MPELKTKSEIKKYLQNSIEYNNDLYSKFILKEKKNQLIRHIMQNKDWINKTLKWINEYKKNNNIETVSYVRFSAFVQVNCNYR